MIDDSKFPTLGELLDRIEGRQPSHTVHHAPPRSRATAAAMARNLAAAEYRADVQRQRSTLAGRAAQIRVARAVGLDLEYAERLTGDNDDVMADHAIVLKAMLKQEAANQQPAEPKQRRERRAVMSAAELNAEIRAETADMAARAGETTVHLTQLPPTDRR